MNTAQVAQGRWRGILTSFGIDESFLTGKHTPCPVCGGKDRFRFIDKNKSNQLAGNWVCNQCNPGVADGFQLLTEYTGKPFADIAKEIDQIVGNFQMDKPAPKKNAKPLLERIARGSLPLTGDDPASRYLQGRGITQVPMNVRYHPGIRYYQDGDGVGTYQAMVSRIQDPAGNRVSFHIIYLQNDKKANLPSPKKILPPDGTISGCGVYLGQIENNVLITEGIETGLAGMELFEMPAIAALSAGGMERIQLPESVEYVSILGDKDKSYRGQQAAYNLAHRLAREGQYRIEVCFPDVGKDFLDDLNNFNRNNQ